MAIVMLLMTFPPLIPDEQIVTGAVTKYPNGDLEIDNSTHTIEMNGAYKLEGNLTVKGNSGKLILINTDFTFITPNFKRFIKVEHGGQIQMQNATFTVDLESFNFYETLDMYVRHNGRITMTGGSSIECDGTLNIEDGSVYVEDSTITQNSNDGGKNDTCVYINMISDSYMLLEDSKIDFMPDDGFITVDGTSTFIAINSAILLVARPR